jgi:transposase
VKPAHLIEERRDEKLPVVPLPGGEELAGRKLLANYGREQRNRTGQINTLHALFAHQGHTAAVKKYLSVAEKRKAVVELPGGQEREEAEWLLKYLDLHERRLKELRERIQEEAKRDGGMKLLQTVAGAGPVAAYAYAAHAGDGSRFSKGAQVSNCLGFVPRPDYSGTIQRQGHITKRGNGYVRGLLIQAARPAVRSKQGGALRERYRCRTAGVGTSKKKTLCR